MIRHELFIALVERALVIGATGLLAIGCASETGVEGASAALERGLARTSSAPRAGRVDRSSYAGRAIYRDGYIQLLTVRGVEAPERVRAALESGVYDPVIDGADWPEGTTSTNEGMNEVGAVAQEMVREEVSSGSIDDQVVNPAVLSGRPVLDSPDVDFCSVEIR